MIKIFIILFIIKSDLYLKNQQLKKESVNTTKNVNVALLLPKEAGVKCLLIFGEALYICI